MLRDWGERDDAVAAAASCPMTDCGALALACRPADGTGRGDTEPWEFLCPRCGVDFIVPEEELVIQWVPMDCLLEKIHAA